MKRIVWWSVGAWALGVAGAILACGGNVSVVGNPAAAAQDDGATDAVSGLSPSSSSSSSGSSSSPGTYCVGNLPCQTLTPGGPSSGSPGGSPGTSGSSGSSDGEVADSSTTTGPTLPLDGSDFDVQPAPAGLAGFAFVVNGVEQTPMSCPAEDWEYAPPAAQKAIWAADSSIPDIVCDDSYQPPCHGMSVFLANTGQFPVAYTAQYSWSVGSNSGEPPGVPFGNQGELSGVLNPGDKVDITSAYLGGIVAVLGSSQPFADPDAGKYVADGATIPWPTGVAGSGGATQMYVAEIEVRDSCGSPTVVW